MRNNFKLLGAVAVAGIVATTGSAFTDSNTLPANDSGAVGYSATTVTGITISSVGYTEDTADGTKVKTVTLKTSDTKAASADGILTLKDLNAALLGEKNCGLGVSDGATTPVYTYTCTLSTSVSAASIETTAFTVLTN